MLLIVLLVYGIMWYLKKRKTDKSLEEEEEVQEEVQEEALSGQMGHLVAESGGGKE